MGILDFQTQVRKAKTENNLRTLDDNEFRKCPLRGRKRPSVEVSFGANRGLSAYYLQ